MHSAEIQWKSAAILQFDKLKSVAVHVGLTGWVVMNLGDDKVRQRTDRQENAGDWWTPIRPICHAHTHSR